jgi:hypothetical protein
MYSYDMDQKFKIEGIYDQRTLKLLKSRNVRDFGFNFSPKSFNFIQEHVFLDELIPLLDPKDRIYLHFSRSNDPMIKKVIFDLQKVGVQKDNIFIDCDEWSDDPKTLEVNYFLNYYPEMETTKLASPLFSGMIFNFSFFEDLHRRGVLNNFIANFYTHFKKHLTDEKKIILKIEWNDNVFPSLFDYLDVDLMSFSINSQMEVCYRNVDLKKLATEMELLKNSKDLAGNF